MLLAKCRVGEAVVQQGVKSLTPPRLRGMIFALNHGITWPADLAIITRLVHVGETMRTNWFSRVAFYHVGYVGI